VLKKCGKGGLDMTEAEGRALLCELGRRMWQRGWVAANDGNLSLRLDGGAILTTPTGVSKGFLRPEELVLVTPEGTVLLQNGPPPSSELPLHLMCYARRPDVGGVCHAHPPAATAFACARRPLRAPFLSEAMLTLGAVPLAPYGRTGTPALAEAAAPLLEGHDAILLANHGALTLGRDGEAAYFQMERLEHTACICLNVAQLGGGVPLPEEERAALAGRTFPAAEQKEELP